jgi:DNA repair exonuclease SbcCD nuclease subunit
MSYLLVGDLHLTDRPRDAYRFGIFDQIARWHEEYNFEATFIMGDLTDAKDRHSAILVNRIVDELSWLNNVFILMGNHDYIDRHNPFFGFLNKLEGIYFITKPDLFNDVCAIPHCRTQEEFDQACWSLNGEKCKYLLVHNTFNGAISESGRVMSGLSLAAVNHVHAEKIYAGDIHRPQLTNGVEYVGAPYHIRFGDDYEPHCLLIDGVGNVKKLHSVFPHKWKLTIRDANDLLINNQLKEGDQVKIVVELAREETVAWKEIRHAVTCTCADMGLSIHGLTLKVNTIKKKAKDVKLTTNPIEVLSAFSKEEGLSKSVKEAGLKIMEDSRV